MGGTCSWIHRPTMELPAHSKGGRVSKTKVDGDRRADMTGL
jgi:hypothetical protein